ncbi:flagellar hook capping FlgD N-terminal domain-containing protein [Janthinobacterium sp. GB4P2]|uniref:flagellar hook capping FlgD N-terminal domain-containing protein n=1 Tax=Janthinobacterium sp. GB4P2 TaxID=3424189 RepID=UPI003F1E7E98
MAITSTAAVGANTASQSANIGIEDFLKILTAQLNSQDPLKPVDNQEFVAQIAQFASLEQGRQINDKIESLLGVQSAVQSVGLLGKTVDISLASGSMTGTVSALDVSSGTPLLTVSNSTSGAVSSNVTLAQILRIR